MKKISVIYSFGKMVGVKEGKKRRGSETEREREGGGGGGRERQTDKQTDRGTEDHNFARYKNMKHLNSTKRTRRQGQ